MYRTIPWDDGKVAVIAKTKPDAEEAYRQVQAAGINIVSPIESSVLGFSFVCIDPADESKAVEQEQQGYRTVIRGPSEAAVNAQLAKLVRNGAKLVSAAKQVTGERWMAVCDNIDQLRYW